MPTLEQLRITHRYAEKSVARNVGVPDMITEDERIAFLKLQQEYEELTLAGLEHEWLSKPRFVAGPVSVTPGSDHPTRTIVSDEPDDVYESRIKFLNQRINADVQRRINKLTDACKVIQEMANITVTVNMFEIRQRVQAEAEVYWRAAEKRVRLQVAQPDQCTEVEMAVRTALAQEWTQLRDHGLSEGWLVTKAHVVVAHPLDHHPRRMVRVTESEATVAARVAGLDAYIGARVTE